MDDASAAKPLLTIRPSRGWSALNLPEVWQFRDLMWTLAGRDLKLRYKQTLLGAMWVVVQPLMAAGIFTLVFGMIAGLPTLEGIPYFVLTFAGTLGWTAFNNTLGKSSGSMVGNAHLVSKVYFPRLVLPISSMVSTLVDFAVAAAMMVVMLLYYRINPGVGLLLLPVWMGILLMLALGLGLLFAALMVSYRDVAYILPVVTQLMMYATPVYYTLAVPHKKLEPWMFQLYMLNPLASVIEAFRWSIIGKGELYPGYLAYSAGVSVLIFIWGAFSFKKMERKFADII
jgi:lipopolysaccharide transport system permease protein